MVLRPRAPLERLLRPRSPALPRCSPPSIRHARLASGGTGRILDKSRIMEKPERFNPPSHGSRLPRKKKIPRVPMPETERRDQSMRRYPNSFPPEGTFMHWFLTNRAIHVWITMGVLVSLGGYTFLADFLMKTEFRDELPSTNDLFKRPFATMSTFIQVYKKHTRHESEKVAAKRMQKLEDVQKKREYMRAHGVEPGFLTGRWMESFGTVEGDEARKLAADKNAEAAAMSDGMIPMTSDLAEEKPVERRKRKKPKMWLGIWGGD